MADSFIVRIDLNRLASNLSKAEGKTWTPTDAVLWLAQQSFIPRDDDWVCEALQLELLDRTEYRIVRSW